MLLSMAMPLMASATELELQSDSVRWLDDVTVTAIKQQRDLSVQPFAATVADSNQIARWNINAVKGMSEVAPNFYIPQYGSRMTSSIYMRGIGARMEQPAVGLSIDNVTLLNKNNYDFDVADVERIEILRGPQSTLYGRNTMAGMINIYTVQPMKYQGSKVLAMIGNGPSARFAVSHYIKFRPDLAMSFSGLFNFTDGFFKNHYNAKKVGAEKNLSLRWRTQWQIRPEWTLDNVAAFSLYRQGGYPYEEYGSGIINYNDTCYYRRNSLTDGLTVKWTQPGFSMSSITTVQYLNDNMTLDQDFLPINYFTLTQEQHEWALTQDFVARGTKGIYSWIGGLYGFYKHTHMHAPVTLKDDGIARLITDRVNNDDKIPVRLEFVDPSLVLGSHFKIPVWGFAAYHQSSVDVGRFNLAAGLRLDYEATSLKYNSVCNTDYNVYMKRGAPMPIMQGKVNIDEIGNLHKHFLELLPKITVSYKLPMNSASNVYASVGKGYKSGGYNTQMFSEVLQQRMMKEMMAMMPGGGGSDKPGLSVDDIVSYKPEKSWNYEVGAHIGCADGRVMTDLALFYIDCRDQQLTMFPNDDTTTGRITTNAGKTRSFGAEFQLRYNPTERWAFNASYGYTNAKFVKFTDGKNDYKDNYVPYAPVNTIFGSAAYNHNIGKWNLEYNLRCRGVGRIYWNEENDARQPMYALLGASITARLSWLTLEAWMENVTGTRYNVFHFTSLGSSFVQRGNPRTFGLTVKFNFDR